MKHKLHFNEKKTSFDLTNIIEKITVIMKLYLPFNEKTNTNFKRIHFT